MNTDVQGTLINSLPVSPTNEPPLGSHEREPSHNSLIIKSQFSREIPRRDKYRNNMKYHNSLSTVNYFCSLGRVGHISGRLVPSDAVCISVSFENYPEPERFMCCTNSISK